MKTRQPVIAAVRFMQIDELPQYVRLIPQEQLNLASAHAERLHREMNGLAATLLEYSTAIGIYGVGKAYGS